MAKIVLVLAWAGLALSAPQRFQSRGQVTGPDSASIVSSVLSSLDIQGAITAALAGRSGGGSVSRVVSSPPVTRVTYSAPKTVSFSPVVTRPQVTRVTRPQVTRVISQSSGASGLSKNSADIVTSVLNSLSPSIQAAVASALQTGPRASSTSFSSGSSGNLGQTEVRRVTSVNRASGSAGEGGLVQRIIVTLTPTIRDAVSTALAGNTVSRESFTSNYVTATQSINREDVAMKVMDALEPTIATQVARAIESLRSTQIAQLRAQVTVSESQKESLVQQIIVTLTPTIRSAVHTAMESQASARLRSLMSQVSTPDQASVTAQILAALRPQVVQAVNTAASAQEAAERQRQAALIQQQRRAEIQRQAALREQQRLEAQRQAALIEQQRQAALIQQQRQAALLEQQRLEAERQAALRETQAALFEAQRQAALQAQQQSVSSLSSLFGSGHEVRAEVPGQTTVEYHIGFGQPLAVGLSSGRFSDY